MVGVKGHAPKDKPSEAEVSTKEPSKGEAFNEKTSTAKKCSDDLSKTASGELQRIRFRETHFDESGMIKTTDADAKPNMQVEKSEGKVTYAFIWERIFDRYNKYSESNVDIVWVPCTTCLWKISTIILDLLSMGNPSTSAPF